MVYNYLCISGFFCKEQTTFANRYKFRCQLGFYCPLGTGYDKDLDRPLDKDSVYIGRTEFYIAQKMVQYCMRQEMVRLKTAIEKENKNRDEQKLPLLEKEEEMQRIEEGMVLLIENRYCSIYALVQVLGDGDENAGRYKLEENIKNPLFHADQLVKPLQKPPADHTNKCLQYNPAEALQNVPGRKASGWPSPNCKGQGQVCPEISQLECLCTNRNATDMAKCFKKENGYPDPACLEYAESGECADWTLLENQVSSGMEEDDFDGLAVSHQTYVHKALLQEVTVRHEQQEKSWTRCPFGTMTPTDGQMELTACQIRIKNIYLQESIPMVVSRINPIDFDLSTVNWTKASGEISWFDGVGTIVEEENFRPVYSARARSAVLITFDVRHLPPAIRYGTDWRIRFFLNDTLDPAYDDPLECGTYLKKPRADRPDKVILNARKKGCTEIELPNAFDFDTDADQYPEPVVPKNRILQFFLHPIADIEWRVEVQILNGMYLPDRFAFIRSAVIEMTSPQRAHVGTDKAFVVEVRHNLNVELPYNMPMKTILMEDEEGEQEVLTKAFLNWLPWDGVVNYDFDGQLVNPMRHPAEGENEYYWFEKMRFFTSRSQILIPYLPYFSNCKGYGRTIPLWNLIEQDKGCDWSPPTEEDTSVITRLSLGRLAKGDSCRGIEMTCLMDEVPNNKMEGNRWFEAPSGTTLFYITRKSITHEEYLTKKDAFDDFDVTPVMLVEGGRQGGELPQTILVIFQYWQNSLKEKYMIKGEVYFFDFINPTDRQRRGRDPWNYTLNVMYLGMSHTEVMIDFAFPWDFYFILYIFVGFVCIAIMGVFWMYHRIFTTLKFPPKLSDARYTRFLVPPVVRGTTFALAPCFPTLMFVMGMVRGSFAGFKLPFFPCPEGISEDQCVLGVLDWMESSWNGETAVTETTPAERRYGRTGMALMVLGGYLAIISIKCFVPESESRFYEKAAMQQTSGGKLDDPDDDDEDSEEAEEDPDAEDPIFCTHVWKRSCFAFLMFSNTIIMTVIMQFSFSSTFTENIWFFLVLLYVMGVVIDLTFCGFMCETLLIVPINNVIALVTMMAMLAADTLFEFLMSFFVELCVQVVDRTYLSPNQDYVVGNLMAFIYSFMRFLNWLVSGARASQDDNVFDDVDSDDEGDVRDDAEEVQAEDMIGFLAGYSTDLVGVFASPLFVMLCWWVYEDSQILKNYKIEKTDTWYYMAFFIAAMFFQTAIDVFCLNVLELFHGWRLMDYFEYCEYRFQSRPQRWKGRGETYDETVSPHLRSLDIMCFSEQFYFVVVLNTFGMIVWMIGLQTILINQWNIFDDPASSMVFVGVLAFCSAAHVATLTTADYLRIWQVHVPEYGTTMSLAGVDQELLALDAVDKKLGPKPPPRSVLAGWTEPTAKEPAALQRYREAFLKENQLWLQHIFADLIDQKVLTQYRQTLLLNLAKVLDEIQPQYYSPFELPPKVINGEIIPRTKAGAPTGPSGFEFDAEPPMQLASEYMQEHRFGFESSDAQALMKLWLHRAKFVLHLTRLSAVVKPDSQASRDSCELCARVEGLQVVPIYTLTHLASLFRQQRDMSPLWNTPLWQHYYKTFTPTCVLCERCSNYYFDRNLNVPVDEARFRRLKKKSKGPLDYIQESNLPSVPLDENTLKLVRLWLDWSRRLARGEEPKSFLALYGFEHRTLREISLIRLQAVQQEEKAEASEESEHESEESSEEDPEQQPGAFPNIPVNWAASAIMRDWLHRARQGLTEPQLHHWRENVNEGARPHDENLKPRGFRLDGKRVPVADVMQRFRDV